MGNGTKRFNEIENYCLSFKKGDVRRSYAILYYHHLINNIKNIKFNEPINITSKRNIEHVIQEIMYKI